MGPTRTSGPRWQTRIWIGLVLFMIAACSTGIWILSSDARREIDALATANSDSSQWALAQSEVELLLLQNALLEAQNDPSGPLDEVRLRFDIFYSRQETIKSSPSFAEVRALSGIPEAIRHIDEFLAEAVPIIDGPDAHMRSVIDDLAQASQTLREDLRDISLSGVATFAHQSEMQRQRVAEALFNLGTLAVILFTILVAFMLVLVRTVELSSRRAEESQLAQSRLRSIVGTSLDGILVVGQDGRVVDLNAAAQRIFGYSAEEAIGQNMADLFVPDHLRAAHDAGMKRHRDTGERRVIGKGLFKIEARDKHGRIFPVEMSISTAESEEGEIYISFIRDISRREAAERELVDARDRALAGEKAKASFLAVMSHEMRTPLNGILGTLQLIERTDLSDRQRDLLRAMGTSGEMLLHHVNSVLDISRADAGKMELASDPFDPIEAVREVADSLAIQAQSRGNRIAVREIGEPVGIALGDEARLRQVLMNLVGNAIKFTRDGSITIEAERLPEDDFVEFRISDTGIGISEAELETVFDDFVTLDTTFTREVEGTGLGLGIVKRLVSVMQGELGVESEPGEGSVFSIRVPLPLTHSRPDRAAPARQIAARAPAAEARSVLHIEDNEINRMVTREMLAAMGYGTTEATDGLEGVELAEQKAYDLILMDISMPRLDGVEACRRIRNGGGPNARTPIVALTAHALPADIRRFEQAGMTDVIVKPLDLSRLALVLDETVQVAPLVQDRHCPSGDLISTLGEGKAREVTERAMSSILSDLGELLVLFRDGTAIETIRGRAHNLAGLAAVVGKSDLRGHLVAAETAAAAGRREEAKSALEDAFALATSDQP